MSARTRRSPRSLLATFVFAIGATAMLFQSAAAFGIVEALLLRTAIQTVGISSQERQDRASVNERRDQRLAGVDAREAAIDFREGRGWMLPQDAAIERARLVALRDAIRETALRERQITSYQARRRVDAALRNTIRDAVVAATGVDSRIVDTLDSLLRGERPLQAVLAAALTENTNADPREAFAGLRDQLRGVQDAASAIGGSRTFDLRGRLAEALREATGLADGIGPVPDDKIERLRELFGALDRARGELDGLTGELVPRGPRIDDGRFAHDDRWVAMNTLFEALDSPLVEQRLTSAILLRTVEHIIELAEAEGIALTPEQLGRAAMDALSAWVDERRAGTDGGAIDLDRLARDAINETLAAAGAGALPEAATIDGFGGLWAWGSTTHIRLTQAGSSVDGPYGPPDDLGVDGRRLDMEITGERTLEGFWLKDSPSQVKCDAPKNGSQYWGRMRMQFDESLSSWSGEWTYCDSDAWRHSSRDGGKRRE